MFSKRERSRLARWLGLLLWCVVALAACGGDGDGETTDSGDQEADSATSAADADTAADDEAGDGTDETGTDEAAADDGAADDGSATDAMVELDTLADGVITVAIQPYGAYTEYVDGELTGLDSEILQRMADTWGYEIEVEVTDFAGMLGGVQSGRVDVAIGGIAWSEERAAEGLFTDAVYYSPTIVGVANDETYDTIADLEGLDIGTVEGYVWADSITAIPAELHVYPDATGVIDDLGADRIDAGFLDLFLLADLAVKRPELGIETQYLPAPTPEEIEANEAWAYLGPYTVNFYVNPDSPLLQQAMDDVIHEMYASGEMSSIIEGYGGDPDQILVPFDGAGETRIGVDRDAGWSPPSL